MATLHKRGKKWYLMYYQDGRRRLKSTKTNDKRLAFEALRKFEEEQARRELGLEPIEQIKPLLLSEFIEAYEIERRRIGKSSETVDIDLFALRDLMRFTGDYKLETVNSTIALQYRNHLLENVAPATASIRLRAIRTAFNWAVEKPGQKYLRVNLFQQKGLIPSVKEKRKYLALTPDEKRDFLSAIEDPNHQLLFKFFLLTGCRRSEVVNLDWSSINLENKVIVIRQSKTHRTRIIPITIELMQVIAALDRSKSKPFPYGSDWLSSLFRRYRDKAGLREELHLHCLRHSCATTLVNQGIPLHKVKDYLGHSTIKVTEVYLHTSDSDLREVAEVLTCTG